MTLHIKQYTLQVKQYREYRLSILNDRRESMQINLTNSDSPPWWCKESQLSILPIRKYIFRKFHNKLCIIDNQIIQYNCARHNFSYTRGWMQMVFYSHIIYSPETDRYSKTWLMITVVKDMTEYCTWYTYDTYSVHKGALMSCRARPPCLPASWERLTSSTVWCQLPVLFPAW